MTKDKLKYDIIRTICCLNSDISNKDKKLLIELLNSIVDYTNNTELEQELAQLQQKYNELVTNINEVEKLANDTRTKHNSLYSDISNYDRNKLINLLNSIVDYTNNTELEQKVTQLQQKHNELVETVEELETKLQTYSDKVDNLETRVQALENSSQS